MADDDAPRENDVHRNESGPLPGTSSARDSGLPALPDAYDQVKRSRSASLWSGLILGAVVLLILLIFILQNLTDQQIKFLFWQANLPVGVSLLIAAILGALVVGSAGGLRIVQLRRAAKKLQ